MIRLPTALSLLAVAATTTPSAALAATAVTIPWGDWIASALAPLSAAVVPVAAAVAAAGVAKVAPWASSILTRQWIESAIRAGADYGQNAVAGAVRGRSVSVDLGPAVVAAGTKHVIATSPARVVRKAGGVEGVAARIFRALPLDEKASTETVLTPALHLLRGDRPRGA